MDTVGRARLQRLLALAGEERTTSMLERLAARAVTALAVSGAGITVFSELGGAAAPHRGLVSATSPVSQQLDELQLTVGEGPSLDVFHSGSPVLIADLDTDGSRWPGFSPSARECGAAAVFSFPLRRGPARLGSLDAYRDTAGPLSEQQHSDALLLAEATTQALLDDVSSHGAEATLDHTDLHAPVHEATGMIAAQLGVNMEQALLRLRAHAYTHDLLITDIATQVTNRTLRLHPN